MIRPRLSTAVTIGLFVIMYAAFAMQFPSLLSGRMAGNLLTDSAYLGILAVGMTMVIVAGGIDLSLGAVMAFSSLLIAIAVSSWGLHPLAAFALALVLGTGFGALVGATIHVLEAPPFIVTLTAMFLARGGALMLSQDSTPIREPLHDRLATAGWPLPDGGQLSAVAIVMLAAFAVGGLLLHHTRFGAEVFAIGGDRRAAALMGARVGRTTVLIYAFSGFMAALAGVVFSIYTQAGFALSGVGVELEAIAAVVIGGALLTGGSGGMLGTLFGVMIQGLILTYITLDGTLSSWWSKIVIGGLILAFLLLRSLEGARWLPGLVRRTRGVLRPGSTPPPRGDVEPDASQRPAPRDGR